MPSHTLRISTACVIVLAALTGACADDANLTGPNAPRQPAHSVTAAAATAWTASGPGTVTLISDGTAGDAVMSYVGRGNWTFTTTAAQTGTVTLPWSYSGNHGFGSVFVGAVVNNVLVGTLVNIMLIGQFSFDGTFTFNVNAGDTYGFQFGGSNVFGEEVGGTFTVHVPPSTKDDCKDGGWAAFSFSNQGECILFFETGRDNR